MQTRPAGIGEHIQYIVLGRKFGRRQRTSRKRMPDGKWVRDGKGFAWIPRTKGLFVAPVLLPPGLKKMKRILPSTRHKQAPKMRDSAAPGNGAFRPKTRD